jgi:hypothetical protein
MMFLVVQFFSINDVLLAPVCFVLMFAIIRGRANACPDFDIRKYYYRAFYFKMTFVLAYVVVTEFYFEGGDTSLYYQAVKDLRASIEDDFSNFWTLFSTTHLDVNSPLAPFFLYDNFEDVTYNYMQGASNFFVPKIGFYPSLIFFNSYLCICFCLSMFALGGSIRIFKTFRHYYPTATKEIALATLFLPSVNFWSSGLLKDTICYGAVGFILYACLNIFIKKRKYVSSIFWIVIGSYLLFVIKTYIFLVLLLAITIWMFAETNKLIKDRTLRQIFAFMTFTLAIGAGYFLLQYFTSQETLKQYQLDNIINSAETQRNAYSFIYEQGDQSKQSSYYTIQASNPFLLIVNSIVATFYRPFPWEIKSVAAILSAVEAFGFVLLTLNLFLKRGLVTPFRLIFKDPRIMMCFIFAIVFAVGVGASTANFGTLSRYKIPCMPFYLMMLFLLYRNSGLRYPNWLKRILGYPKT